jgi:transcription elongation factor GreA
VKIRDLDAGEHFDFTIVAGDFMDLDAGHVSLASPIGRGLLGAKVNQEVKVRLPIGERRYLIIELVTLPQQLG